MEIFLAELIGTAILVFIGTSTSAAVTLKKSSAHNSGWVFITLGWGFAVLAGATISFPISGGHLNPAVSLAMFLTGSITFNLFIIYVIAQILGGIIGAYLTYQIYYDHFKLNDDGDLIGIFATVPSIKNTPRNYFSEIIATFILILFILMTGFYSQVSPVLVPLLVIGIGISVGNVTGYAINPARDLGPRLMYQFFFKHKNKGSANWKYQPIPFFGPLIGSILGVLVFSIF